MIMNKKILFTLLLCAGLKTGTAQRPLTTDSTTNLPNSNLPEKEEETVLVYGRKTTVINAATSLAVINNADVTKYAQPSFVAAFNTVPGVKMDERSPGSYRISIRGNLLRSTFGVRNVKVYLNSLPLTDASGNTYFNAISPTLIEKLQIIKGPGGSMYGAGTGGVILMNNDNTQQKKALTAQVTGGSYGLFTASLQSSHVFKKGSGTASVSHEQSEGYRAHSAMERNAAGYTLSFAPNAKNNMTGTIFYSNLYYQTPGGLTVAQVLANPRQARPAAGIFKSAETQKAALYISTLYASLSDEIKLGRQWKNNSGIYFSYTDFKNPTIRNYEKKYERGAGGRTVFTFERNKISIITGAELQSGFINTATHGNRLGVKDTLQYNDEITVRQLNVFTQLGIGFGNGFLLTGGLSYNNFYYGFYRVSPAENPAAANFKPQYIPRLSLQKRIPAGSIYAAYSQGYSPPTIDEIHASDGKFNDRLGAEKSVNYELGIKLNGLKKKLFAEIILYNTGLQNTITSRREASGADFFTNAGRTRQNGLEFSFTGLPVVKQNGPVQQIKLQITGSFVDASFRDYRRGAINFTGNKLTGTAPFNFAAVADVVMARGIYTNLTYTYTDKIPVNDANSFYAKAYNLLFVKLGYKKRTGTKTETDFFAAAMHSFNNNYSLGNDLNADATRFYNPAAINTFTAGIKLSRVKL